MKIGEPGTSVPGLRTAQRFNMRSEELTMKGGNGATDGRVVTLSRAGYYLRGAGITRQQATFDFADNVRSPETSKIKTIYIHNPKFIAF